MQAYRFNWKGRIYELVDTPGFDDTHVSDTEVLRKILVWLEASYKKGQRIHGLIYLHRISDIRLQGSAKRNLHIFRKICGESGLNNVVLATTFWDVIDNVTGVRRETAFKETGGFWHDMIRHGSRVFRLSLSRETCLDLLESFGTIHHSMPQAQGNMILRSTCIDQTTAVQSSRTRVAEQSCEVMDESYRRYEEELFRLWGMAETALSDKDAHVKEQRQRISRNFAASIEAYQKTEWDVENRDHEQKSHQLVLDGEKERRKLEEKSMELNLKEANLEANEERLEVLWDEELCSQRDSWHNEVTCTCCDTKIAGAYYRKSYIRLVLINPSNKSNERQTAASASTTT